MTPTELLPEIRAHIARKYVHQTTAAEALGISRVTLSHIVNGRRAPCQELLDDMGLFKLVTVSYEPLPKDEH